jgi:hypothetical protein
MGEQRWLERASLTDERQGGRKPSCLDETKFECSCAVLAFSDAVDVPVFEH